jgi:hypothetical protein
MWRFTYQEDESAINPYIAVGLAPYGPAEAFVGDLAMNARFMRREPGPPIFAEDIKLVLQSWRVLLDSGARIIYPAHGRPFSSEVFEACVS